MFILIFWFFFFLIFFSFLRSRWELFFFFFLVLIENHTSFPLTFAIVTHPWNSIYGEVFGSWDLDERLICLRRDSFRPSQTRRSWPLSRHFAGSSFIPPISSLIHTQKVFNFKSNCSYFVKECDFVVFWEYWNCYFLVEMGKYP